MTTRAIVVGAGAFFVSASLSALWAISVATAPLPSQEATATVAGAHRREMTALIALMVAGPIIETFLFPLLHLAVQLRHKPRQEDAIFIASSALIGWLFHGADGFAIGRAVGFAMLAHLYVTIATRYGSRWAFAVAAFAHICWNGLAFGVALTR